MGALSVREILASVIDRFERAGIETPAVDARALVAFGLSKTPIFLRMNPEFEIEPDQQSAIEDFVRRRLAREPVSKITQTRGFWRLDFKVTKDVLDPRPDSETLIEEALKIFPDRSSPLNVLDLGTGSGCLAQALLCEFISARAVGVDSSAAALAVADENAVANGLSGRFETVLTDWNVSGWAKNLGRFDLVISNPPYIAETEKESLDPEVVLFDPKQALFGGRDGLDAYRKIAPALPLLLKKGGVFIAEFGKGQENDVRRIICSSGLSFNTFGADLAGIIRCLSAFY